MYQLHKAMNIDFDKTELSVIPNFKGGEKEVRVRMFDDGANKIMKMSLVPGASVGMHVHEDSSEIVFILSGCGSVVFDGEKSGISAGDCHYCPKGHSHSIVNDSDSDLEFFAVVPKQ